MNTKFKYSVRERIVGIFMLSILILLMSAVILLGRGKNWFQKYNTYYTSFNESYNLKPGAAVKFLETDIGKVKDVRLVENRVKIRLAILEEYASRIRADVVAKVESPTFIGSEYIAVVPGSMDALPIPPEGELPSVARKDIADYFNEFEVEKTAKALVETVQQFSAFVEDVRNPDGPFLLALEKFNTTATHVEKVARRIEAGEGTVGRMLNSTELVDAVLARLDKADAILDDLAAASTKTPETIEMFQENLVRLQEVQNGVTHSIALVRSLLEEMQANMPKVKTILDNAEKGSREIPNISKSAVETMDAFQLELENVDLIIQSLRENFLIRGNLPPPPAVRSTDAHLRD
jgi:phospholipid/cholesterol/gamma-HCH transport system substrate-binding protein